MDAEQIEERAPISFRGLPPGSLPWLQSKAGGDRRASRCRKGRNVECGCGNRETIAVLTWQIKSCSQRNSWGCRGRSISRAAIVELESVARHHGCVSEH